MRMPALALIAAALAATAGVAMLLPDSGIGIALIGWLALVFLLALPAAWWRSRGGGPVTTWLVAVFCPLVPLELLLAISAYRNRDVGGDLQGIEVLMMTWFVPPIVLVAGSVVALLSGILVEPRGGRD
ncbi:MAG TPA: hypothetical protein VF727_10235 [Allosphingosinicella sp.]|jgi:hypothetical protein